MIFSKNYLMGLQDGSVGKNSCQQAQLPEFDPRHSHDGRTYSSKQSSDLHECNGTCHTHAGMIKKCKNKQTIKSYLWHNILFPLHNPTVTMY